MQAADRQQARPAVGGRHEHGFGARQGPVHRIGDHRQPRTRHMRAQPVGGAARQRHHARGARIGPAPQAQPHARERLRRRMGMFGGHDAATQAARGQHRQHRGRRHHAQHDIGLEILDQRAQGADPPQVGQHPAPAAALARRIQRTPQDLRMQRVDVPRRIGLRHQHDRAAIARPVGAEIGARDVRRARAFSVSPCRRRRRPRLAPAAGPRPYSRRTTADTSGWWRA